MKASHIVAVSKKASESYNSIVEKLLAAIKNRNLSKPDVVALRDRLIAESNPQRSAYICLSRLLGAPSSSGRGSFSFCGPLCRGSFSVGSLGRGSFSVGFAKALWAGAQLVSQRLDC